MAQEDLGRRVCLTLIDTDVLIDFQRGLPAARSWLASNGSTAFYVPGVVGMELLVGSRSGVELARSIKMLRALPVLWNNEADNQIAAELIERHCLSTGLGLADFLIAAQALNRNATLLTFNLKHFRSIPGLDVQIPYARSSSDS